MPETVVVRLRSDLVDRLKEVVNNAPAKLIKERSQNGALEYLLDLEAEFIEELSKASSDCNKCAKLLNSLKPSPKARKTEYSD